MKSLLGGVLGALLFVGVVAPQQWGVQMTGSGTPSDASCTSNRVGWGYTNLDNGRVYVCRPNAHWEPLALQTETGGGSLPSGAIYFITSGTCPAGSAEATDLDGLFMEFTLAAHADVGGTGGADSITPTGTNGVQTFIGDALAAHGHGVGTFANDAVSAGTPAGTIAWPGGVPTFSGASMSTHVHGVGTYDSAAITAGTPAGTNSTSTVTPLGTIAWPAGVPTFAGTASTVIVNHTHTLNVQGGTTASTTGTNGMTSAAAGGSSRTLAIATANPSGGAANYTPAGTLSWPAGVPTLSGSSSTVGAQTFTGSAMSSHDHSLSGSSEAVSAGTPAGTVAWPAGVPALSGSAMSSHGHTISGTSATVSAGTPSGTISVPAFVGDAFNNRPAFMKVIPCRVN